MKSINNIVPLLGLAFILSACNYNNLNFPGYDSGVSPTNVFAYVDSLTSSDFVNLSSSIKKKLKTHEDTIAANYISVNKMFHTEIAPAATYIPLFLSEKYLYGDTKSSVMVTSPQYIAEEGEMQILKEKYVLDSVWFLYNNEILKTPFDQSVGDFTIINVIGSQLWSWDTHKYVKMSGYANNVNNDNEDWLISPSLNLSKRKSAFMSFTHTINKGDTANLKTNHTIWLSTDYLSGEPSTATWIQLTIPTYPNGISWTFVESGAISFPSAALGNTNVHIAFKYLSSNKESATWEVKNLLILENLE